MKHISRSAYFYIVLISIITLFVYKWSDLHLPYFWDEMWVYARGAIAMAQHGIGLLPSSLDPDISRGHPLLFYTLSAIVVKQAHFNVLIVHIYAFSIFILLVLSIYYTVKKTFDAITATVTCLLFMVQPVVVAQSGLLLPEVMLALCCWWAVYFMSKNDRVGYIIMASLGLLVKETAVTIPAAVLLAYIILCLVKKTEFKWANLLFISLPLLILVLFFVIQKLQNGWFIFPYHEQIIATTWHDFMEGVRCFKTFLVIEQRRTLYVYILGIGLIVVLYKAVTRRASISPIVIYAVIFIIVFFIFCSFNAINPRYILPMLPWLALLTALTFKELFYKMPAIALLACAACVAWQWNEINPDHFEVDVNEGYAVALRNELEAATYIQAHHEIHNILSGFPMNAILISKHEGYPERAKNIDNGDDSYYVNGTCGNDKRVADSIKTDTVATFKDKFAVIYVLKIRH